MRIIGGENRGLTLASVGKGDPGAHLRPTTDRVRESIFNMLLGGRYGDPVTGARVLDLFAGTGALGLEALSRGAASAVFIDSGRPAQKLLRENIAKTGRQDQSACLSVDIRRLPPAPAPAELIFLDPPYGAGLGPSALAAAQAGGWIALGALILCEEAEVVTPPGGLTLLDTRRYGDTVLTVLRAEG
ncbi:16S rRNA (guanine(966)-N(2))-methyltransferase RsmD [Pseudoroseicyclus aestuarii]|uniref:16S rRNA (Guanine966-N2)-methyltransferase n=1 Tax=Pseudoroseicyclus aestuarii TaxID=1795041 RepID=A0A318T0K7_9RHOB|nr:16S rRNA (guanine(966)-N(2))-methyltransferase RsmD [Pseudoroseicyclus aestuarii]PYE83704.1 16S rRNA (guanine966-N2)-methyltransferase [Pseudoroseicyclus aestuarii]